MKDQLQLQRFVAKESIELEFQFSFPWHVLTLFLPRPLTPSLLPRSQTAAILRDNKLASFVDPDLKKLGFEAAEVAQMLQVALLCMKPEAAERPSMDDVAKMLSGRDLAGKWAQWQEEAAKMSGEEVMAVVNTPSIWENTTTGISLDAFNLTGPR